MEIEQVIHEVLKIDKDAYEKIIDFYYEDIYCYVLKQVGDHEITKELCQDIFFEAYRSLKRYFYVDNYDEHTRSVNRIEREFSDFESEMRELIEHVKAYPYDVTIESDSWCIVEANKEAHQLSDEALEDYLWFKDMQLRLWSSDPIDSYEAVVYLDEARQIINSGHIIGQYGEEFPVDFNVKPSSTLSGNDEVNGLKISSYKYLFEEMEEMQWLSAMKIDFGTLNPDDYEVQVKVNEEAVPLQWWIKDKNTRYIASNFIPLNLEVLKPPATYDLRLRGGGPLVYFR